MEIDSPFDSEPEHEFESKINEAIKKSKVIQTYDIEHLKVLNLEKYFNYIIQKSIKENGDFIDSHDKTNKNLPLMIEAPKSEFFLDSKVRNPAIKQSKPLLKRKIQIESRPVKMIKLYNGYYIC